MKFKIFFIIGFSTLMLFTISACVKTESPPIEAILEEQTEAPSEPAATTPPVAPIPVAAPTPVSIEAPAKPKKQTVLMTAEGFSPAQVNIPQGSTVIFVNQDSVPHWPASGIHPTHQLCPGFDALQALEPGQTYSFIFTEAKTCPMHDHLNPSVRGSIVVE